MGNNESNFDPVGDYSRDPTGNRTREYHARRADERHRELMEELAGKDEEEAKREEEERRDGKDFFWWVNWSTPGMWAICIFISFVIGAGPFLIRPTLEWIGAV